MKVYEFQKCFLDRMKESESVLCWNDTIIPASLVKREWSCYIELQIEPAGWQALWKIPRIICEELKLRFPTVVFGCVDQVLFHDLKAVFVVTAVQDDDVHIPERHEVSLIDLWATINQENDALNVERTADCLDRLRFFYTHVWMPWDNDSDDDRNWVEIHLDSRIQFACNLHKRKISRALAAHIRTLLIEARYIQERREYLELDLSDNEPVQGDNDTELNTLELNCSSMNKSNITDLMRLHLRLAIIRGELEILENPEMLRIYDEVKFNDASDSVSYVKQHGEITKCTLGYKGNCYIVMKPCRLERQIELMQLGKQHNKINSNCNVHFFPTLQQVLNFCQPSDDIILSPGRHTIKFLEYLNDNGSLTGLHDNCIKITDDNPFSMQHVVVTSIDDDSILLVIDGDFTLKQLVLDCRHIRTGILIKKGKVHLSKCRLIGDNKSSTQQAIVCSGTAQLVLEDCLIESFATGITLNAGTTLEVQRTTITQCSIAVEITDIETKLNFSDTRIIGSNKCGVYVDAIELIGTDVKSTTVQRLSDLHSFNIDWLGECDFENCERNIYIFNQKNSLMSEDTRRSIIDDSILFVDNESYEKSKAKKTTSLFVGRLVDLTNVNE